MVTGAERPPPSAPGAGGARLTEGAAPSPGWSAAQSRVELWRLTVTAFLLHVSGGQIQIVRSDEPRGPGAPQTIILSSPRSVSPFPLFVFKV